MALSVGKRLIRFHTWKSFLAPFWGDVNAYRGEKNQEDVSSETESASVSASLRCQAKLGSPPSEGMFSGIGARLRGQMTSMRGEPAPKEEMKKGVKGTHPVRKTQGSAIQGLQGEVRKKSVETDDYSNAVLNGE